MLVNGVKDIHFVHEDTDIHGVGCDLGLLNNLNDTITQKQMWIYLGLFINH